MRSKRRICRNNLRPSGAGGIAHRVILFNAGVIHRAGPHRLNVQIARKLAEQGIPSLRFDLAGLHDSASPCGTLAFETQAIADLRSAMNVLGEARKVDRFALFGFCPGAYHGYLTALADERMAGLVMYDVYHYMTLRALINRHLMSIRERGWLAYFGSLGNRAAA